MKNLLLIISASFICNVSHAGTIVVQNTNNTGTGSLRDAITLSVDGDTIRFNPTLISAGSNNIVLTSEIAFAKNIVIKGLYNSSDTLYISGNNSNRIFNVGFMSSPSVNKTLTLDSLALINGYTPMNGGALYFIEGDSLIINNCFILNNAASGGGGVYSNSTLILTNSSVLNNTALINEYSSGGGISVETTICEITNCTIANNLASSNGGGLFHYLYVDGPTDLAITNSQITDNSAGERGGGLFVNSALVSSSILLESTNITGNSTAASYGSGGGIFFTTILTANNCSINDNLAGYGAGIFCNSSSINSSYINSSITLNNCSVLRNIASSEGGGIYSVATMSTSSTVTLNYSTLANNTASLKGGGIYSSTPGSTSSVVTVNNSTLTGNSAYKGGGIFSSGYYSWVALKNSTVSGNAAGSLGGGLYSYSDFSALLDLKSCIIALNGSSNIYNYVASNTNSPIASQGFNVFSDAPVGYSVSNDQINKTSLDLNLLPLANNGGLTQTLLPGPGSVAINMGDPADITDAQNGIISGGIRDVGAAETVSSLGIKEIENSRKITIYPNPTSGNINVQFEKYDNATFKLYDYSGKSIYQSTITNLISKIDLKDYENGIYIMNIECSNGEIVTKRITLQK